MNSSFANETNLQNDHDLKKANFFPKPEKLPNTHFKFLCKPV